MPTPTSAPGTDRPAARCLNLPDRGVAPGAASRLPRWRTAERPTPPPRATTEFPSSPIALPQADGAA